MPRGRTTKRKKNRASVLAQAPPAAYLAYGVVAVLKGRHKGRLGYYDNDSDTGKSAIVYLNGAPVGPDYVLIFKKWLRDATKTEKRQWETQHLNQLAYYRAVRKLGRNS